MKYFISLLLIIFTISFAQSQIQSGEITYSVTADEKMMEQIANEEESNQIKSYVQKMFENQLKAIPYLVYQLEFNEQESSFSNLKNMNKDNGVNLKTTMRNIGVYGNYYTNIKEKENLHQFDYGTIKVLIKQNVDELDWTITNETKSINGYRCYKAVTYHKPDAGLGGEIIAWFTPDIPFQFGPIIYSSLPGMILELKQGYYIFTAQEIEFSQKDIIIARPTKGKNIDASMWPAEKNKIKTDYMKTRTY